MDEKPLTPDEKAAADATRDIMLNVTGGREWKEYDEKYVRGRILRAIRDAAKATAIVALCLAIPAQAQDYDYQLNGATVHRHVVIGQQCYRVGIDPNGFDWQHDGPCGRDDFAWIGEPSMEPQKLHFRDSLTKPQLQHTLTVWMFDRFHVRELKNQIVPPMCMSLPANQGGDPWWWHKPPCRTDDIGIIDKPDHIEFRQSVTAQQLRYAIALAITSFSGMPLDLTEYPFYRPLPW